MDLKDYLEEELKGSITNLKAVISQNRKSLRLLETADLDNSKYTVYLNSCWADHGEKSTTTNYEGSLEDAIKNAERRFMQVNNRSDVQANYFVKISLGKGKYEVPEKYWKKYQKK